MLDEQTQSQIREQAVAAAVRELIEGDLGDVVLLTPEQVAACWSVSVSTVNKSRLKPVHIGKYVRYRLSDVRAFLESPEIQLGLKTISKRPA